VVEVDKDDKKSVLKQGEEKGEFKQGQEMSESLDL